MIVTSIELALGPGLQPRVRSVGKQIFVQRLKFENSSMQSYNKFFKKYIPGIEGLATLEPPP